MVKEQLRKKITNFRIWQKILSGDKGIENLANRIFGDNIFKANDNGTENSEYNSFNNTIISGFVFNPRESHFNTNIKTIKQSTYSIRNQSIADKDDKPKSRKLTILDKETNIIPEKKNENWNEKFWIKIFANILM